MVISKPVPKGDAPCQSRPDQRKLRKCELFGNTITDEKDYPKLLSGSIDLEATGRHTL